MTIIEQIDFAKHGGFTMDLGYLGSLRHLARDRLLSIESLLLFSQRNPGCFKTMVENSFIQNKFFIEVINKHV